MWAPDSGTCGNGVLDDGEACDYRAPGMSCCCSVTCQLQPAQTVCNDGAFCSAVDRCTAQGTCVGGDVTPCPGADGDGDCTETCNEPAGDCSTPDPADTPCTDGDVCNGSDSCTADGVCQSADVDPCEGGAECADHCNADGTCFTPLGIPCTDDGNLCTIDICDGDGGCAHVSRQRRRHVWPRLRLSRDAAMRRAERDVPRSHTARRGLRPSRLRRQSLRLPGWCLRVPVGGASGMRQRHDRALGAVRGAGAPQRPVLPRLPFRQGRHPVRRCRRLLRPPRRMQRIWCRVSAQRAKAGERRSATTAASATAPTPAPRTGSVRPRASTPAGAARNAPTPARRTAPATRRRACPAPPT